MPTPWQSSSSGNRMSDLLDRLVDRGEGAADVLVERVVERDGGCEPSDLSVRHRLQRAGPLDEDVLDDLDRRPQADAAGRLGQRAEQVQQDVEMRRQEGIEIGERLAVEAGVVELGVRQLGVLAQRLPVAVEQRARVGRAGRRFAEQAAIADLLDVARFQVRP